MIDVPYTNALGSLMYVMISIRLNLCNVMSLPIRFMSDPDYDHQLALKHVFAYLSGTLDVGLWHDKRISSFELVGFVDTDFADDKDVKKYTIAYSSLLVKIMCHGNHSCSLWLPFPLLKVNMLLYVML